MKKICNMNFEDTKKSFIKFSKKHKVKDDFDMNGLQLKEYAGMFKEVSLNNDKEKFFELIYNLFNYGFMAGYKQHEAESKAAVEKNFKSESHRKLTELIYNMPFGYHSEYFYTFMCGSINREVLEYIKPKKVSCEALAEHDRLLKDRNDLQ